MRFQLVDRILELESGQRARGLKNVARSEDFFEHHFGFGDHAFRSLSRRVGWEIG